MPDPLIRLLAELPSADPAPPRAERTRIRCHARLERQARSASRVDAQAGRTAPVWQPLIAVLGVAYLTEVIVQALRLYGLFVD